jgi:CheY-like chemotaxis protein
LALELLHSVGLAVDTATNGWEAVERARQRSYDLILMDMQTPVMDGMAATRAIRALPSCSTTPIVAFTANAFSENREQCRESGMDDFIVKPVDPELLYQTLLQWLPRNGGVRTPTAVAAPAPEVSRSHHALPLEVVLAGLHGVDSSYGLKVMRGDAIRYANLLSKFVERSIVEVDTLQTCMMPATSKNPPIWRTHCAVALGRWVQSSLPMPSPLLRQLGQAACPPTSSTRCSICSSRCIRTSSLPSGRCQI